MTADSGWFKGPPKEEGFYWADEIDRDFGIRSIVHISPDPSGDFWCHWFPNERGWRVKAKALDSHWFCRAEEPGLPPAVDRREVDWGFKDGREVVVTQRGDGPRESNFVDELEPPIGQDAEMEDA